MTKRAKSDSEKKDKKRKRWLNESQGPTHHFIHFALYLVLFVLFFVLSSYFILQPHKIVSISFFICDIFFQCKDLHWIELKSLVILWPRSRKLLFTVSKPLFEISVNIMYRKWINKWLKSTCNSRNYFECLVYIETGELNIFTHDFSFTCWFW